jgi:hypothetical protein
MKKMSTYILIIALISIFSIAAYAIGYVNGSDKALRYSGIDQMISIRLYSKLLNPKDISKLKTVLLAGIEAADETLKETTVSRSLPSGYYNRFMTLLNSDMGSDAWLKMARDAKDPAIKNLENP